MYLAIGTVRAHVGSPAPSHSDVGSATVTASGTTCAILCLVLFLHGRFPWPLALQEVIWHFACRPRRFIRFSCQCSFNPPAGSKLFCFLRNSITFGISCPSSCHVCTPCATTVAFSRSKKFPFFLQGVPVDLEAEGFFSPLMMSLSLAPVCT